MDRAGQIAYGLLLNLRDARWQDEHEAWSQAIRDAEERGRSEQRDYVPISQPDGHP